MKKFIAVFCLLITTNCYADNELRVKGGYLNTECPGLTNSPVVGIGVETRNKWAGIELEVESFIPVLRKVGTIYFASVSIIPKIYIKDLYAGLKIGYVYNYAGEDVDVRNEPLIGQVIGINLPHNCFIESQFNTADLSVQHRLPYEIKTDEWSRLNNWQVLIGKRIKF